MSPAGKKAVSIYQLKVTLKHSKPPIWRRIQVAGNTGLDQLHQILQIAMGWGNYHLHQFVVGQTHYGITDPDFDLDVEDERAAQLSQIAPGEKGKFAYQYDFGDYWEHDILVEKILEPESGVRYPLCLKGKRACPPEDCGGVWGYEDFLGIIRDPTHPEHEEMLTWIGGSFDPEAFDVEITNQALEAMPQEDNENPRFGQLPARYAFALNPYEDARFSKCPKCDLPTRLRKFALLVYIEGFGLLAQGKTCRFCPPCELLIVHQDELESELAGNVGEHAPEVLGNDYLVIGTVECKFWRKGLRQAKDFTFEQLQQNSADFETVLELYYEPGGWYPSDH